MTYQVFWHIPDQIIGLRLEGELTLYDFAQINQAILDLLGKGRPERSVSLVVDISQPAITPRNFAQLKDSQTYTLRHDLRYIAVAGTNKFMRLMTLLTFNLSRPSVHFFDNVQDAIRFIQSPGPISQSIKQSEYRSS